MKKMIFAFGLLSFALFALVFDLANVRSTVWAVTSGWAINGDNVYFTDGNVGIGTATPSAKLHIAKTPVDPTLISEVYDGDGEFSRLQGYHMAQQGNILVAGSDGEVTIMDVSDPSDPDLLSDFYDGDGQFTLLSGITGLAVEGDYLYILTNEIGGNLMIVDISDPTDPTLVATESDGGGEFDYINYPGDIVIDGDYAYITSTTEKRITTADISNKSTPTQAASYYYSGGSPLYLYQYGDYLYAGFTGMVSILDVSNPTSLSQVTTINQNGTNYVNLQGSVRRLSVYDDVLYIPVSNTDTVITVDVSDPSSPTKLGEITDGVGNFSKLDSPRKVSVYKGLGVVTGYSDNGVTFVDFTNPSAPTLIEEIYDGDGTYSRLAGPAEVYNDGKNIYISSAADKSVTIINNYFEETLMSVSNDASVGIGTLTPAATLDVEGFMRLEVNSSAPTTCDATTDGSIALTSNYYGCTCKNGTGWVKLSDGSTSCSW